MTDDEDTIVLPDGIELLAPGAAWLPSERTLVVADVHAGYTASLRARGYGVPVVRDDALCATLTALVQRTQAERVVVAGDFVHGRGADRLASDGTDAIDRVLSAIAPAVLTIVAGNHDRALLGSMAARGLDVCITFRAGPHVIHHGDDTDTVVKLRAEATLRNGRVLLGHLHPALSLSDGAGTQAMVPAFVTARSLLCLPALSPLSRGMDVRSPTMRAALCALAPAHELGVAVVLNQRVRRIGRLFANTARGAAIDSAAQPTSSVRIRRG